MPLASPLEIVPLEGPIGASVRGLDLEADWSPEVRAQLQQAWSTHHLLSVHQPGLSEEAQLAFVGLFGPLWDERPGEFLQFVSNHHDERIISEGALLFHSDLAFTPQPVLGLSLYGIEIPKSGAQTFFANAARAWRRLGASTQQQLRSLHARHLFDLTTQRGDRPYRDETLPDHEPRAVHPACLSHPRRDFETLYVSRMQTDRIVELSREASDTLLAELFEALYAPDNVYEHEWREGDLLVWDNLALQHARPPMPAHETRTLRRATLATAGVADQVGGAPRQ